MIDRNRAVDLIEQQHRERPYCAACGAPTVTVVSDGAVWLECSSAGEPKSPFRRLFSLDAFAGHTHQLIIDADYERVA